MRVVLDIEANGLLDTATIQHCLVAQDIDTGEMYEFVSTFDEYTQEQMFDHKPMLSFLDGCTTLIAHNGIDFDLPFLNMMYGWTPKPEVQIIDTIVMSRHLNPDRPPVQGVMGPHSVEAWGKRLGRWKPDHQDWSRFSPEMLHRCREDVEIQVLIYRTLCHEATCDFNKSIFESASYLSHDWSESMTMEHKSAEIMARQGRTGCYFEKEKAIQYVDTLQGVVDDMESKILVGVPPKPKQKGVSVSKPFKKNGEHTKATCDWFEELTEVVSGPFSRIEWHTLNLNSDKQVKEWLLSIGWQPDEWNYKKDKEGKFMKDEDGNSIRTSPKITESSLEKISHDLGPQITLRSKATHRRNQIQGWVSNCRDDGRITAGANAQGTNTGRMKHRIVANVPKANADKDTHELIYYPDKQKVFFGTEMRSLFAAPPVGRRVLVGRDASGLELRCFAHYINDDKYTETILTGDIHTYNQEMAGLTTRDQAKTFIYAFLYGAGDAKIGEIVAPDADTEEKKRIGAELKASFLKANPKLDGLIKGVRKSSGRGWLKGLDGRKLWMRRSQGRIAKNKALNTLLQGAGAIIMTYARVWLDEQVKQHPVLKDDAIKVLDYHDEETYEVSEENAEALKELMIQSVVEAGKHYNLNIPLDADAQVGMSWAEIH